MQIPQKSARYIHPADIVHSLHPSPPKYASSVSFFRFSAVPFPRVPLCTLTILSGQSLQPLRKVFGIPLPYPRLLPVPEHNSPPPSPFPDGTPPGESDAAVFRSVNCSLWKEESWICQNQTLSGTHRLPESPAGYIYTFQDAPGLFPDSL